MKNLVEFIRQSGIIAQARGSRAVAVHTSHILIQQYSEKFPIGLWRAP
jgi:hypothetical protein